MYLYIAKFRGYVYELKIGIRHTAVEIMLYHDFAFKHLAIRSKIHIKASFSKKNSPGAHPRTPFYYNICAPPLSLLWILLIL